METIAKYTLRSKDKPLVHFCLQSELEEAFGEKQYRYQVSILETVEENKELLPLPLKSKLDNKLLLDWINHRKAPKNRQFVNQIMNAIEDSRNPLKYVDISHALSLNDAYWITNDEVPVKWQDFNLYDHPFDEALAYVAFTGYHEKVKGVITSPELTSSGMLKKCWTNRNDGIYLLKGDDFIPHFDLQARLFVPPHHALALRSLLNFEFTKHPLYNVSDEAVDKLSQMVQLRAKRILGIYQKKKQHTAK